MTAPQPATRLPQPPPPPRRPAPPRPATAAVRPSARRRSPRARGPVAGLLSWLYALVLAAPLYYLVVSALKTNIEIFTHPFALPEHWLWRNFSTAWRTADLGQALLNSALISAVAIVLTLGLALPAAYALARLDNRLARLITGTFSVGFLIPPFAALIPTVVLSIKMNLFYTREFQMLFLPAGALPLSVLLLTQFMRTVPPALVESAALDGAGNWRLLVNVFIPIAMPGVVSVTILQLLAFWNEYLFSLTITGTAPDIRTAQVALPTLVSDATDFGVLTAGTVLTLLPVYVAYSLSSRRMQEALTAGAVKG
ncbi:carbohydrate ABC transporter permease [Actinacidiphila acididurans]|uniref:Carbohydrate ABC transporter permease n=1 Tax=Actinacidiphila acididurans TaxID=2784346 RepID=A0ABS2TLJ5_9ACTN|nr:carbohydrate ABC transporter permease [Actinacidiphila acididurans]MBM9504214.1 carbohydrate ABC transporter permease [Actinacidiphila acididurans]